MAQSQASQPPASRPSGLRTLLFTGGFTWFACWIAMSIIIYGWRNWREEASSPPTSPLQLLKVILLCLAIAAPGLMIALIARRSPRAK